MTPSEQETEPATDPLAQGSARVIEALLAARDDAGVWRGELSSSALSTATALFALHLYAESNPGADAIAPPERLREWIRGGVEWISRTQNTDGGWGDTVISASNINTTALCWAALSAADPSEVDVIERARGYLTTGPGPVDPDKLANAIKERFGKDHTFSVPILMMCALSGQLGSGRAAWGRVPQLPFELAAFPRRWFQWLRLPVVSYALPALIAIGLIRHTRRPSWNPFARTTRSLATGASLRVLRSIQPQGGGFLEATPLTSFVAMAMIGAGHAKDAVVKHAVEFLAASRRADGSWPIDTNLATWQTTLAVNALAVNRNFGTVLPETQRQRIREWLLAQQYREEHPYTLAAPGAWAWTDLPGGVPDADDTAGALLALWHLGPRDGDVLNAARAGVIWLLDLQNSDGGIPTFCRGWTNLPFDRSGSDLTAHAIHAWSVWRDLLEPRLQKRVDAAIDAATKSLQKSQRADGAWAPLWFGNEAAPSEENPVYGTSRVLTALCALKHSTPVWQMIRSGSKWLAAAQNPDGGWGGGRKTTPSIEETALAIQALAAYQPQAGGVERAHLYDSILIGARWLLRRTVDGTEFPPAPIGFYFANLWYFDRQYPLTFCAGALVRAAQLSRRG